MLELLTGAGLALAAGLNAWIPLLALGLLARFTDLVALPAGWTWIENEWVLVVFGVLLALEIVADKVPALDSANDVIQTVIRPTAGGIVFGAGSAATTATVTDPAAFIESSAWVPVAVGIALALLVHLAKAGFRVFANTATAGLAAPVVSTIEDAGSVALSLVAILVPVLVILGLAGLVVAIVLLVRRRRRRRSGQAPEASTSKTRGTPDRP